MGASNSNESGGGHSHAHGHSHGNGQSSVYNQEKWNKGAEWYDKEPAVAESVKFYCNLLKTRGGWEPGKKVLDFGCGPGKALLLLGSELKEGVGYDLSPAMIKFCKEKAKEARLEEKLTFKQLESEEAKDIEGEEADVVICAYVLHHVDGGKEVQHRAFGRLCDATVSGGTLLVCEFASEYPKQEVEELLRANGMRLEYSTPYSFTFNGGKKECMVYLGKRD